MRIHYILHAAFEKLGAIESWVNNNKYQASGTHTYRNEQLPTLSEFDMLIIMGGPQCVLELDKYPYLREEITLIQQAIHSKKAVLGICLGAQLISEALGAKAEQSPKKEIGVYPVVTTQAAKTDPLFKQFPEQFDVMHWHNDMPGLAPGSVLLASSAGCPRQAFRYNDRVYGFQFHMELTPELVKKMTEHCAHELQPEQYVQTTAELMQHDLQAINQKMYLTLDYLAGQYLNPSLREPS